MSYRKGTLLLLLVISFTAAALAADEKKAGELTIEPYVFETATGQKVEAELGRLVVPENRSDPRSNLIEVAFVRFKSTAKTPGPPIVYLAGGPGGSGIASARGSRFPLFMALREIGDVIAFDQRGTGMAKPNLECSHTYSAPLDKPADREEILRLYKEASRACAQYWREQGVDLAAYNTNESADDLEALRQALGAEKISLWGISYGTHLALATIRRHAEHIHRAILAGVEGPDHTLKLPSNIQRQLERIARRVRADAKLSKQIPDLLGLMKAVLERLESAPVTVEVTDPESKQKVKVTVGKFDLQVITAQGLGSMESMRRYPAAYYAMSQGDFSFLAEAALELRRGRIFSAMSHAMDCASGVSEERWARIKREEKETLLGRLIDFPFPEVCEAWAVPDLGATFRAPVRADVPVLFISGTLDARTPVSNADQVRSGFSNHVHLIVEGAAHSDPLFLSSPKIKGVMLEFLKGVRVSTTRITLPRVEFAPLKLPGAK